MRHSRGLHGGNGHGFDSLAGMLGVNTCQALLDEIDTNLSFTSSYNGCRFYACNEWLKVPFGGEHKFDAAIHSSNA